MFIENDATICFKYASSEFMFPKNILIPMKDEYRLYYDEYNYESFLIDSLKLNFDKPRFSHPSNLLFVINTICHTNCYYCYADRRIKKHCSITIERFREIIKEAKKIGVEGIDITGGEFFLHKDWDILLYELVNNGYNPYISTKIPLQEIDIIKLKNTGLKGIQVSLDSVDAEILSQTLETKDTYISEMEEMLYGLERHGLSVSIHSIITKATASKKNLEQLFDFIEKFSNIRNVRIDTAARSIYLSQEDFINYRIDADDIKNIVECVENRKRVTNLSYLCGIESNQGSICASKLLKLEKFNARGKCSGNTEALVILPDGAVTICEELYWNNRFLLGNIIEQDIKDIWSSQQVLNLYDIDKHMISDLSACKVCDSLKECRKGSGVCWRDIINSYGSNNWDFPDPRCPKAPTLVNDTIYGHTNVF